ncbi:gliding motility protein GldN [Dysgonomonas sp. 520]|uniref:type IX secretion system ring protein PorN/GldN n=1 Tax=Dysgonomonas sp. 520 TaxID=2302931 RepID=UPI0013D3BA25|nr:gliding motility protein GldN [Dysgonomonas sp. 520]NDW08397.1 gliding motility protein GldN [Dysgonomonas sp. 520]
MKRLFSIALITFCGFAFTASLSSQESVRDRINRRQAQQQDKSIPQLTVRAENMNADQKQEIGDAPWLREIYRYVDMNKEKNAALYFPEMPIGDRMNLFTMAFKLLANGEIEAFEYLPDGREVFTEAYKLKMKDFLDNQGILYKEENGKFVVEDFDIPSNEVLGYYVKEAWYFDKSSSVVDTKILAICPILFRQDDFGVDTTRYPLFWLPYENIRPYAQRMPIMTSNLNNAQNQTIDDYFRKRSYDGEIYKTTNMRNQTLAQYCPTDSLMKREQRKIENQLVDFNKKLWAVNDTVPQLADAKTVKKAEKKESTSTSAKRGEKKKESTPKAEKAKSSSAPAKSMRNRRR